MVKLSIVVPVYNVEEYLRKCLDSLINQTLSDIEILCVNDGSKDSSLDILNSYAEKDIRVKVLNQPNKGQSAARNLAISKAVGEYLGFVDSDDWVDLDYFEKLYDAAKKHDADIACAGFKRCGKVNSTVRKSFKEEKVYADINDKVSVDNLPEHNYIWNKIYKREKWHFTFSEGRYFEDMAVLIKILYELNTMVTVPATYYNYRRNPGSTVTLKTAKHKTDFQWAKNEMHSFADTHGIIMNPSYLFKKREVIKMFGLTFLKVYYYENIIKYKLFGFIPFLTKEI